MKTVAILGSTGSIGRNTLKVVSRLKGKFKVVALAAGGNTPLFAAQLNEFRPQLAAMMNADNFIQLKKAVKVRTKLVFGEEGVGRVAACGADIVVMAIGGSAALLPTLVAMEKTKRLALANKESLVMAGDIVMQKARHHQVEIIPVDSEHSAIFQCLKDEPGSSLERIYLTGSGGPLKDIAKDELEFVPPHLALRHPKWQMGKKISIDSATLMNKGFEVIEAHYLFNLPPAKISVLIHPEAVVHSLVQFVDGVVLAQLGIQDMRIPIQYALTYPLRLAARIARLDFSKAARLSFQQPDLAKFPCLDIAMRVAKDKGLSGAVLNACDEECVGLYLKGKIKLTDFARLIEMVLAKLKNKAHPQLEEILQTDKWAREQVRIQLEKITK